MALEMVEEHLDTCILPQLVEKVLAQPQTTPIMTPATEVAIA